MADVDLPLSNAEALILFEYLAKVLEPEKLSLLKQGEEQTLANIICELEKVLVEPLAPDYGAQLKKARELMDGTQNE